MFADSNSGLSGRDRMKINSEIMADAMGLRMTGNGVAESLGQDIERDMPQKAEVGDMLGLAKDGIPQDMMGGQDQMMMMPGGGMPQEMPQQGGNPFAMSQFNNSGMPDVPITTPPTVIGQLLNDDEVPESLKEKYWFIFHKDNALTFLDEDRKRSKLLNMDVIKIDILNATPYYDYTFDKELEFDVMRNMFETKLDRALGYGSKTGHPQNERVLLQSQFSEQRHVNDNAGAENQIKGGFLRRLLGRR